MQVYELVMCKNKCIDSFSYVLERGGGDNC
jgi:hypothetical protein